MKIRLLYFFAGLALFAGLTQTAVMAVMPNTNVVCSFNIGFAQGTCNDGTNTFVFGTRSFQQRDPQYAAIFHVNNTPVAGLTGFENFFHLGDPDYYQGYIYAPLEAGVAVPQGSVNVDIAIYTATNLALCSAVSISNYQSEVSAVCLDPVFSNSVALFATSWASTSANDGIYEYSVNNLTNLAFVRVLPMSQTIYHMQGIICVDGMLYILSDNGLAGEVYQVNPTNGVVVHLARLNVAGQGEWEGLDYFQGYLVANEGNSGTVNWFNFFGLPTVITGTVDRKSTRLNSSH